MGKQIWKPGTVLYPLPAVIVSCGDFTTNTDINLITIGWTGIINTNPPKTYISIRPSRHSYEIIKKNKDFVINLSNVPLAKATDFCGVKSGKDFNKFKEMNLTPFKSQIVKSPSIKESPINMECTVFDIIELGSHHMFLSDIVSVTVEDEFMDENGKFHFNKSCPICYSHGEYFSLGDSLGKFGYSVKKKK